MESSYQNRISIYGGLPEEHDLQTMQQHANLMRNKYINHTRYYEHSHKETEKIVQFNNMMTDSLTLPVVYSLLGASSYYSNELCILNLVYKIPLDKWPFSIDNIKNIEISQTEMNTSGVEFSAHNKKHFINFSSIKEIDLSKKLLTQGFQFTKLLKNQNNTIIWTATGISINNNSPDDWRECPIGISILDISSGIFVALLLSKKKVHVMYSRIENNKNENNYTKFISTMCLCSREPGQEHTLQISWNTQENCIAFTLDEKHGVTITHLGLAPGIIYSGRRYNAVFTSVKYFTDCASGNIVTDNLDNNSGILHFGIGNVNLMDYADYEHPSLQVKSGLYKCNYECVLTCSSLSISNINKKKQIPVVNENVFMAEISNTIYDWAPIDWNHFFTLNEIYKLLGDLALKYPERCRVFDIGKTPESYRAAGVADIPITAIYVGNVSKNTPHMLLIGGLHSREQASINPSLAYLYWLVCSDSAQATKLRSSCALVYLPVADPASYIRDNAFTVWDELLLKYVNVPGHFLRKNSSNYHHNISVPKIINNTETGVDIDRNFGVISVLSSQLTYSGTPLTPPEWKLNSYLQKNGTWGMGQGSSNIPQSPIYRGNALSQWPWYSYGGNSEIETRAIQRLCQDFPFRSALIHSGVGYRLSHPQFPTKTSDTTNNPDFSDACWTVSSEDKDTYVKLCRQLTQETQYVACAPHVPASGTAVDWIYTSGQVRKVRGQISLGTLSFMAETGDKGFYPSFDEMSDIVANGIALNFAIHSESINL